MALYYAANRKIKTLDKGNMSRDVNASDHESQREIIELQKIIQMSIINETQFEIIFHGSRIVQGRDYHMHIEYYKNNMLAPHIQPWPFIVRFAGTGVCYFIGLEELNLTYNYLLIALKKFVHSVPCIISSKLTDYCFIN